MRSCRSSTLPSQPLGHTLGAELTLGPLPSSDARFMRRVRVHQAWYRATVLGVDRYGSLAGSQQPCGSVLHDQDAARGLNFVGPTAYESYLHRRAAAWGVDPVRCTKYLTSSQTLTFNMFSEVVRRPRAAARLIATLLGRSDLVRLETAQFEFTGVNTPYWLGDRTHVDLLLRFLRADGGLQVVAIETKLADRFSTRRTQAMGGPRYRGLVSHRAIWRDLDASLESNVTRQLTRCHALAQSVQAVDSARPEEGAVLLTLLHPEDVAGRDHAQAYIDGLVTPDGAIATWDAFLHAAPRAKAMEPDVAAALTLRYVDMRSSLEAWKNIGGRPHESRPAGGGARR